MSTCFTISFRSYGTEAAQRAGHQRLLAQVAWAAQLGQGHLCWKGGLGLRYIP